MEIKRNGHALQHWADYMTSAARELTSAVTLGVTIRLHVQTRALDHWLSAGPV
ncbi:hypothetical protein [Nonomuraea turcica]|uniref:hypothetical protein n=1 Tax=Nonomuraea sp. G32 TaxID=3067274 RepID=UPI00273BB2B9|nr:hypothetical protein [Nonomuraea sp. G32]MDP4507918.1 hypothetical protein [Nonomuraea sp. G32]